MIVFFVLYVICLLPICVFALSQGHLGLIALRYGKEAILPLPSTPPFITVQLPVYNEPLVIERLLTSVLAMDYPYGRWEVQVLNDSTDETTDLIAAFIEKNTTPVKIYHIRRENRVGYKAGALQEGLAQANGTLLAIFDADFLPSKNFLKHVAPHFEADNLGFVQARWKYLNGNASELTRAQAFFLDGHFAVEQIARAKKRYFANFNGTGGLWRKASIIDAGGWQSDTLSEDLDLSFRAQLKGWEYRYLHDVIAYTELPATVHSIKQQQYRWNKGGAQCARKHILSVIRSKKSLLHKIHGALHLCNSSMLFFSFIASLCSVPLVLLKAQEPDSTYLHIGLIFFSSFFLYIFHYGVMAMRLHPKNAWSYLFFNFFNFLAVILGFAYTNAKAVLSGWTTRGGVFLRTPKTGAQKSKNRLKFSLKKFQPMETLLALYFLGAVSLGLWFEVYSLLPFHALNALGYLILVWRSFYQPAQ